MALTACQAHTAMNQVEMQALALEWVALLFQHGLRDLLGAAYTQCGLPCFVSEANSLYVSAWMLDYLYSLPDGTASAFLRANGFSVRGM